MTIQKSKNSAVGKPPETSIRVMVSLLDELMMLTVPENWSFLEINYYNQSTPATYISHG